MNPETKDDRGQWTSASNAQADMLCAGRHLASRGLESAPSKDATFGTQIHDALRKQNPEGLEPDQASIYDSCNDIELKELAKAFGLAVEGLTPSPVREKRLWIQWADGLRHSGMPDSVHRRGTRALIVEYKTLPGDVPSSSTNQQLRDQAVLLDFNVPLLQEIGTVVIQPLVTHSPEICVYNREHIMRARDELYARVRASNNPASPRTPGEVQCRHCAAKHTCHEYQKWAGRLAVVDDQLIVAIQERMVADWSPEMRVAFLDRLKTARQWLNDCEEELKALLEKEPDSIPGYHLKPGRNDTELVNPEAIFSAFNARGGTLEQFMKCVSLGKGSLQKALAAATRKKGKALDEELKSVIGENQIKSQCRPSLAREK